jgi:pimeloyl-ACP methyl ester carboxylesterase
MTKEIQVGAQRIQLDDRGAGTPVVLLHSSGLSSQQWRRLKEKLEPTHRVLAPDFIGYGGSAPWAGEADFHFNADLAVAEAVAALAGAPVHLVGHSYGGFIAMLVAARAQVPLASISVFDPVSFGVLTSTDDHEGLADLAALDPGGRFFAPELKGTPEWSELFVDYWGGPGYWTRLPDQQRAAFVAGGKKMFEEVRSLSYDHTPHTAYARVTAPALIITGSASTVAGRHTAAVLARTMPHARLESVEGAGHMAPLSHAHQVNALIAAHIEAVDKERSQHV